MSRAVLNGLTLTYERAGAGDAIVPEAPQTSAFGLRVPKPFAGRLILAAIRESDGTAVAVSESAIAAGVDELANAGGIDASPEGGAAWAGLRALVASGAIARGETVVVVNTGAGVLYREQLASAHDAASHDRAPKAAGS